MAKSRRAKKAGKRKQTVRDLPVAKGKSAQVSGGAQIYSAINLANAQAATASQHLSDIASQQGALLQAKPSSTPVVARPAL